MTLIEQLQQTPLWEKFEQWYLNNRDLLNFPHINYFNGLDFCFQKGVFEKFIENQGFNIKKQLWDIPIQQRWGMNDKQILKTRYVEAWFLRTALMIMDEYNTICVNPTDYTGQSKPFDTFQELLIWYFNEYR